MKRLIVLVLVLAIVISSLFACSKQAEEPIDAPILNDTEEEAPENTTPRQIRLSLEESEQRMETGFGWTLWASPEGMRDGIDVLLVMYVGTENFEAWTKQYEYQIPGKPEGLISLYLFAHEFNLTKEDFQAVNEQNNKNWQENDPDSSENHDIWTDEEIDLIVGDDYAAYYAHFGNPAALLTETSICPPEWLYHHSAEEYAEYGVTPELLEQRLPEIEKAVGEYIDGNFIGEYENAGKELKEAFHIKLSENLAALREISEAQTTE